MAGESVFAQHIVDLNAALEESIGRQLAAVQRGDVDAMDREVERQKNLMSARSQLEVLQGLWPKLLGELGRTQGQAKPQSDSQQRRFEFWTQLLERASSRTSLHERTLPGPHNSISVSSGEKGVFYQYYLRSHDAMVQVYIATGNKLLNKQIYDRLFAHRAAAEAAFGDTLDWLRLDDRAACRICYAVPTGGLLERDLWPQVQGDLIGAMIRLEKAFRPYMNTAGPGRTPRRRRAGEPERYPLRIEFWSQLLEIANERTDLHRAVSAKKEYWLAASAGASGFHFSYVIRTHDAQVELFIDTGDRLRNKRAFDAILSRKEQVEKVFGAALDWQRLDGKQSCRICLLIPGGGLRDPDLWPEIREKMVDAMVRLEKALKPQISRIDR